MLTPCGKRYDGQQDDISGSTDEDMLENTKPNLISSSLSASSSNHTTISVATNSDCRDLDANCTKVIGESVRKLSPCEYSEKLEVNLSENNVSHSKAEVLMFPNSQINSSEKLNKCEDPNGFNLINYSVPKVEENSSTNANAVVRENVTMKKFVSMSNLYPADFFSTTLRQGSSHPQLLGQVEPKDTKLSRSSSSIALKNKNLSFDHIESKVKSYIKHIKNEKVEASTLQKKEKENNDTQGEDSLVTELQQEIQKLQNHLEERDMLLQEVQANHHSLLLHYGEAKNRLDQLRFTTVRPQQEMKSVQTEPNFKDDEKISQNMRNCKGSSIVSKENALEILYTNSGGNTVNSKSFNKANWQNENCQPKCQRMDDTDEEEEDANIEDKDFNKLLLQMRGSTSLEKTPAKVSTWCASISRQPLPVPSCYGSLGSGGSISNETESLKCESEFLEKLPLHGVSGEYVTATNRIEQNGVQSLLERSLQLGKNNCAVNSSREKSLSKESETYFLPVDKCDCWNPQQIPGYDTLKERSFENSAKSEFKETICIPPLNLECSKDSTAQLPQNNTSYLQNSDFYNVSLSPLICNSTCSQDGSISCNHEVNQARNSNKYSIYLDTPTSYKSILINCDAEEKATSNKSYDQLPMRMAYDLHKDRKKYICKESVYGFQKSKFNCNWEKKNFQEPCCFKSTPPYRYYVDCNCKCHWDKAVDHQMLRCKGCISSAKYSNSEILPNMMHFLNNVSACADDLRKRSEAIQSFLTKLLDKSDS